MQINFHVKQFTSNMIAVHSIQSIFISCLCLSIYLSLFIFIFKYVLFVFTWQNDKISILLVSAFANMNSFHIAMRLIDISACYMPCCWMIPYNVLNRNSRTRVNFKWKQYCAAFFCKHSTKSNI